MVTSGTTLRVLLVDDDPLWGRLITRWLNGLSDPAFEVTSVASYEEGLERLLGGAFDACVVDHRLSREQTGLDLLRQARAVGCDVPILLLTANAEDRLDVAALRAGAADYLEKAGLTSELASRTIRYAVERQHALRAQSESERRFRSVFENAPYGMCRITDRHFTAVNPALIAMLGYESADELMAIDVSRELFFRPEGFAEAASILRQLRNLRDKETEWRRKDGTLVAVRVNIKLLSETDGEAWVLDGIVEDITEKRRLAAQLRYAQRMEAVGRLAGGVAHDFNNLLTAILGYAETLREQTVNQGARHDLDEIERAGNRAADLTRQLLAFSRKQVMTPIVCDLRTIVNEACDMLRRLVGAHIRFVVSEAEQPVWIHADPGQIEQVLVNLVVNARDAMPDGGTMTIETSTRTVGRRRDNRFEPMSPGTYGVLTVTDTGCGMDSEVKAKVFEPFFTTKPMGKGTGLGLATVYGIVKQSGGFVWAESEPNQGSEFTVHLPVVPGVGEVVPVREAMQPPERGDETILVVEDEPGVRKLACRVLSRYGYDVLVASSTDEAQEIVERRAGDIDLLVSDVVMPGTSGPSFARGLKSQHPSIRVLFMSGYNEEKLEGESGFEAATGFLPKPFTPDALARKVRDLLDRSATRSDSESVPELVA